MDLSKALRNVMTTGKVLIGYRETKKGLHEKIVKMVVVSSNCPKEVLEEFQKFNVPLITFEGTNVNLGAVCGKPFSISTLAIIDPGESNIMAAVGKP